MLRGASHAAAHQLLPKLRVLGLAELLHEVVILARPLLRVPAPLGAVPGQHGEAQLPWPWQVVMGRASTGKLGADGQWTLPTTEVEGALPVSLLFFKAGFLVG